MRTFVIQTAQGDMMLRRIDKIPEKVRLKKAEIEGGHFILAHSESGHHHVVEAKEGVEFLLTDDPLLAYLKVADDVEIVLEHLRDYDTHESQLIEGGTYEVRRAREATIDGWRPICE